MPLPPLALLLLLASTLSSCAAGIAFPSFISSSMLFQRNVAFTVPGTDAPGASLSAAFAGRSYAGTAG